MSGGPRQLGLFDDDPAQRGRVAPATADPDDVRVASELPASLHLGTSSWSFPGWRDLVYRDAHSPSVLSQDGLVAYARHPLLRAVGLDRTHYAPMHESDLARHAAQVPDDFRFLVKAHEWCTLSRFPDHPRYGARRGAENEHFLDPEYARREVIEPTVEGLGDRLGVLLFQVAPQALRATGGPERFLDRLFRFLDRLPHGPRYAVELRNRELLTPAYAELLRASSVVHCHNAMGRMPRVVEQWQSVGHENRGPLLVRWMLHPTMDYDDAVQRYEPFDRLVDEDGDTRSQIARLVAAAAEAGHPAYVIVNNKAEGSSPLSVFRLAREIARELRRPIG